jgi:uncharacterized LabA/DUF88 family protein
MAAPFFFGQMSKRSIVYVDGLNLYYGAVQGTPFKWLNLQILFERLRQDDYVQRVKYFTTRVTSSHQVNQLAYLAALGTCPKVEIILGKFKMRTVRCQVRRCNFGGCRYFQTQEEKRTDVNIATAMLEDAYDDLADRVVLVSGDSDLVPSVNRIKNRFPEKEVIVYVPARNEVRGAATELRGSANRSRTLPQALLRVCQFPPVVPDGRGGEIKKPADW